jgi:flagellar motor switch/type III secretory pathway protein FliN
MSQPASKSEELAGNLPLGAAVAPPGGSTGGLANLPGYSRSLLRIEVPIVVTLATTRLPVSRILELGPGTIVHFEKSYDSPLMLTIGNCDVAVGDAVKIGDKFGLRISSMVMPQEKFEPVRPAGCGSPSRSLSSENLPG